MSMDRRAWLQEQESIKIAEEIRQLKLLLDLNLDELKRPRLTLKLQAAQKRLDVSRAKSAQLLGGRFKI